jgi:hypothetical protein
MLGLGCGVQPKVASADNFDSPRGAEVKLKPSKV